MLIEEKRGASGLKRTYYVRPGPFDPPAKSEHRWWYEDAYRHLFWPAVKPGYQRQSRSVNCTCGVWVITVFDVTSEGRDLA